MKYKIGELTRIRTGKLDANASSIDGQYPFFTCSKEPLRISTYSYDCECVLVAGNGDLNVKYYNGKFDAYQRTYIIEDNGSGKLYMPYLYYFLNGYVEELRKQSIGGVIKYIKLGNLTDALIKLPEIEEQINIVETLKKVNNIIDNLRKQLQKLDELVKSQFIEMMNQHQSKNLLKEFISSYKTECCGNRNFPILSITKDDGIVFQSEKFKKRIASTDASTYKVVPRGKLVQGIHIDERNFAIQNIADEGIVSPAYKVWNVDESKVIPEVLAFVLRTDRTMHYITSKFTGSVKRRESISINDFMNIPIDLPDKTIQKEFYEFTKQIDKSKFIIQKSLEKTQLLFDSLMQEYFG